MKKLLLFFLLISFTSLAQEQKYSIALKGDSVKEALLKLETKTGNRFFFIDSWLDGQLRIAQNFTDKSLFEILQVVLEDTYLNFYKYKDKIILTRNNLIYDKLPKGFFGTENDTTQNEITKNEAIADSEETGFNPIFYNGIQSSATNQPIKTVTIGKEIPGNSKKRFSLSGVITDKLTGEPISNLAIFVKSKNIGTITDARGYYRLRLPQGANLLETQSLGSENLKTRVVMYNNGELDISLNETYEELGEVFLETTNDDNVADAVTGSETIDVEEIKNIPLVLGERDILKVATTLPGITKAGEGAAGYNVRGGRADQNLILLDDAVLYNPSHFFGLFSALNPFTSGEVNIYKGSIPAKYGGRLSSVFDIHTKNANTQKFGGEAAIGPVTSNLSLEIPVMENKAGLIVGGRATYSDWILKNLDEESLNNSEASFYDIVAKYHHSFDENNKFQATGYFSKDKFSLTSDSLFSYQNRLISLNYERKFSEKHEGKISFSNSDYKFKIDYENDLKDNFESGYHINESELKLLFNYRLNDKHRLTYGVSSKLYMVDPGEMEPLGNDSDITALEIPREKGLESAAFLSDEFKISDKLLLNAGLRYSVYAALGEREQRIYEPGIPKTASTVLDTVSYGNNEVIETYGGAEARISARYFIQPDFSIKAGFNNSYQYIHTLTNNTTVSPTDIYKLSDLNTKPQQANQYSLGLYKNIDNNMYELSVEGYYKRSKNLLDFKTGAKLFLNENVETEVLQGEGKSYGVEFLVKKTRGKLNGWLGYTYSRSLIKSDSEFNEQVVNAGKYFPSNFDKPHDVSLVANYKITKRFSFSANFAYQTGRPVTYPTGKYNFNGAEFVLYSDRNKFRIPDYYRLDLSFNVEGNHLLKKFAHSFWNISVYNVLGRNNPYSVFFVTKDGKVEALQSSIFSVPIPTITYNFKF
ncbi:Outer membrane receptor proteins, mostly Fe transport [Salegentibacter echinorum]|uniref:Outer membrane receptor proteins, mostly Fe transport n=1 Tax=Salegentibacter echinorum TaxID=1073325 RepID=A0A1M5BRV4_SALEC|nr:carboxypeptidase-like regulatory domain-containing protein [Salegentibacter echinorum]SHF45263.1 Outer membrane receptor proteins, mostly Fe transport [Salegentibacter echinorum]